MTSAVPAITVLERFLVRSPRNAIAADDLIDDQHWWWQYGDARWAAPVAAATRPVARVTQDTQVGLGWMLSERRPCGRAAWHDGGTFRQHAVVARLGRKG